MAEKKMGFVDKAVDKKAAEIRSRGPNNAYGTSAARARVLASVDKDIDARDKKDLEAVDQKPVRHYFTGSGSHAARNVTETELMAYQDAERRQRGYNSELVGGEKSPSEVRVGGKRRELSYKLADKPGRQERKK